MDEQFKSDRELVESYLHGDQQAFCNLYERHLRRVYSLCLRITANPTNAEDLVQDVFMQIEKKLSSFRGEAAFTTWLHRVTVNQVLMWLRKKSTRSETIMESDEVLESFVTPNTPMIVDAIALDVAIAKLPTGYRTVFVLHDIEGYEHQEIAKTLGITEGTCKSQLHKARLRLRALLMERVEVV